MAQKSKIEVCRSTHLVSQRSLTFLRYIVLIPFSNAPLLKDSTDSSSNTCFLGEYLKKNAHSFYNIKHALYIINIASF